VDSSGSAYVTGFTYSTNFPTAVALQSTYTGGTGYPDAFVTKLTPAGNALVYSTYLGGSSLDAGAAIAVDSFGSAYVTGTTHSPDFPTVNGMQPTLGQAPDAAFVAKLSAGGNALIYSTYLHGTTPTTTEETIGNGIAVDAAASAYVTGFTSSFTFPTANPFQAASAGGDDVFVVKLNAAGNALVYGTYLGGSCSDQANAIAVDAAGNAYVTGATCSTNFPTRNPVIAKTASPSDWDGFVTKLSANGNALVYSTYLGGSGYDLAHGVAVDPQGKVYVAGETTSVDFPTANAFKPSYGELTSAFITALTADGSAFLYSTYLHGSELCQTVFGIGAWTRAYGIAVDSVGAAYVTGATNSRCFPITPTDPLQILLDGPTGLAFVYLPPNDAFVTKFSPAGALAYSTYLGGRYADQGTAIAVDLGGNAYLTGNTASVDFPVTPWSAAQSQFAGGFYAGDAFVAKLVHNVWGVQP